MKQWDVVMAYWLDSSGIGRWTDTEAVLQDAFISSCWTAGFYIGEDSECIKIASSASTTDQLDHIMYIPKVAVKKIEVLATAKG